MKTLKDFYIVVTKQNCDELRELTGIATPIGLKMTFNCDNAESAYYGKDTKNKERVSLSKLKRYIANIPTREALKKAQNASKIYKYKYEQERNEKDKYKSFLYISEISNNELKEYYNQVKIACTALDCKLTERTNHLKKVRTTLRNIEKSIPQENKLIDSTVVDWVNDVVKERDSFKNRYNNEVSVVSELKNSKERLQYNLDNLRSEREQLTYLAKKDINLGKKTLIEWVFDMYNDEKYLQKECSVLGISNTNLELNNTKLNLENDQLNKELKKYKLVAMASLIITLLALGLWI